MFADRVKETSTTTGTGTLTTAGAVPGYQTFLSAFGTGNRAYYVIDGGTQWEIGIGTVTSGFLTRDLVITNSSGNTSLISFSAGGKVIYCDIPAKVFSTALLLIDALTSESNPSGGVYTSGAGITVDGTNVIHDRESIQTDVDGATITFNCALNNLHQVTLGGNRTLALSNIATGQKITLKLIQDGTGSRTVTWFTTIKWQGGTVPILTTTAAKADYFGFLCTGVGTYDGFIIGQNY